MSCLALPFDALSSVKQQLYVKKTLDLQRAIDICRAYEVTSKQAQEIASAAQIDKIAAEMTDGHEKHKTENVTGADRKFEVRMISDCRFCGKSHEAQKTKCPAWGKVFMN